MLLVVNILNNLSITGCNLPPKLLVSTIMRIKCSLSAFDFLPSGDCFRIFFFYSATDFLEWRGCHVWERRTEKNKNQIKKVYSFVGLAFFHKYHEYIAFSYSTSILLLSENLRKLKSTTPTTNPKTSENSIRMYSTCYINMLNKICIKYTYIDSVIVHWGVVKRVHSRNPFSTALPQTLNAL